MENKYLVVHEYDSIGPAIYLVDSDSSLLTQESKHHKKSIFLFDLEKIKSVLQEVEVNIKIKEKNEN